VCELISYCFSKSIVNSEGLSALPHILHRPLVGRKTSFIDFKLIILLITDPHFPQTISIDGYDMIIISYTLFDRISNFTSRWIDEISNNNFLENNHSEFFDIVRSTVRNLLMDCENPRQRIYKSNIS
jgi:hypothetical protein